LHQLLSRHAALRGLNARTVLFVLTSLDTVDGSLPIRRAIDLNESSRSGPPGSRAFP